MLGQLIGPVTGILDKFIEDKDAKNKMAHEIATMAERHAQEVAKGQMEVNKAEAQSGSVFKGGWRPFIGWTCGAAFAYHFIIQPFLIFAITVFGLDLGGWRPFIGWTCGAAFAYHFIIQPFLIFAITVFGLDLPALPDFDMSALMPVLLGMLGLGGMRSFEKSKGVAAK